MTAFLRTPRLRALSKVATVIRVETGDDGVATITLDRPEAKNALTVEMRDDLLAAVRSSRTDPDVRALLLTGAGDAFCAGMDLRASTVAQVGGEGFNTRSTSEALRAGVQAVVRELWELDKPTVAAVNGTAVGPGAHIALACDFVLLHDEARFAWTFSRWGLVVDAGGAYLLPRLVGLPRARAMVLLGEAVTGREAVDMGLAYKCVPATELQDEARALDKDQDTTEVTLRKGVNVLVVKVVNEKMDFSFCVRFTDKDDKPLTNLTARTAE